MNAGEQLELFPRQIIKARPFGCYLEVRARVERALASGLQGDERPMVERWLDGCRRLDSLIAK